MSKRGRPKKDIKDLAFSEKPPASATEEEIKRYNSKMKQRLTYVCSKMIEQGMSPEEVAEKINERL